MNEKYEISKISLEIFGFKEEKKNEWFLSNWEQFSEVPGLIRSKFFLNKKGKEYILRSQYENKIGEIQEEIFKILNLTGVFYCIFSFLNEICICSSFDIQLIENFYLDKLHKIELN